MKNNHLPNKILTILFFFFLTCSAYSQPVTWYKTFGDPVKNMHGNYVVQTFDGGYVILGDKGIGAGDQKMLLLKLDYLGNLIWFKYPADTIININPQKLVQTSDSGFVILGSQYQQWGYFLLKTDKNGNFLWRKNYPDTAVAYPALYGLANTLDNGFILSGEFISYSPPSQKGYLIKTDSLGNVKWQRGYKDSTINGYGDIVQFPDSNYYTSGVTYNTTSNNYSVAKKFSSTGNVIWTKIFNLYTGAGMLSKILNDRIAIFSSKGRNSHYVTLFDTSGNIIWQNLHSYPSFVYSFNSTLNGNIILSGVSDSSGYNETIAIKKLSSSGDSILAKNFQYQGFTSLSVKNTCPTNDNGFIIVGYTGKVFKYSLLIIKTDSAFNSPMISNILSQPEIISNNFELFQNYPNPFNSSTRINFKIPCSDEVLIKIFDLSGREIFNSGYKLYFKGLNSFILNTNKYNLSSGIYLFTIEYKGQAKSLKLVYLK